jgi:hypothetical protein
MLADPVVRTILWVLAAVLLILYLARRRARLRRED